MTADETRELLGDRFIPRPHFSLVRHAIVDAPVEQTYAAARTLDLAEVHSGLATAMGWLRELPARWRSRPAAAGTCWVLLGEHPGSEFALGAAGKFWRPVIGWRRVRPDDFAAFAEPGYGKLVVTFGVRPYGAHRSLLTIDTRVLLTDPPSWLKFRRYWRVAAPFAWVVHSALLRAIAQDARLRALDAYRRET